MRPPGTIGHVPAEGDRVADLFRGASVLVTGGTGSFGRGFVAWLLAACQPRRVIRSRGTNLRARAG